MEPPYVRILATILNTSAASELVQKRMACRFYFGNGSAPVVVPGKMILHEPSDHSSTAVFILCPAGHLSLEQDIANLPQSVVIQAERSQGAYTYEVCFPASMSRGTTTPQFSKLPLPHPQMCSIRYTLYTWNFLGNGHL